MASSALAASPVSARRADRGAPSIPAHPQKPLHRRVLSWCLSPLKGFGRRAFQKNRYSVMFGYVRGYYISAAVHSVARLGIPDLLRDGPRSAADLAQSTGVDEQTLYRVMRALAGARVFQEAAGERFALTDLGRLLLSDEPGTLRDLAIYCGDIEFPALPMFSESIRTGQGTIQLAHGRPFWDVLADDLKLGAVFDREMARTTEKHAPLIAAAWDFSKYKTVLDVGGGRGALLAGILQGHPGVRGILFDRPEVIEGARDWLTRAGMADRCEFTGGSFLEAVPHGADVYTIKHVLHDWNDESVLRLLKNIRAAMKPGSRLLIIEGLVGENHVAGARFFMDWQDLFQLVVTEGRERTRAEFAGLLDAAGLKLAAVTPTEIVDVLILEAVCKD